jgi:hypothetical protein
MKIRRSTFLENSTCTSQAKMLTNWQAKFSGEPAKSNERNGDYLNV